MTFFGPNTVGSRSPKCHKALGVKQPTVSHHLGLLRMGRLVIDTRKGKSMIYVCDAAAIKTLAVGIKKLTPMK
jgi:DNA-binding transcriptional ArsR family regulator